jgi:hypothetical protein
MPLAAISVCVPEIPRDLALLRSLRVFRPAWPRVAKSLDPPAAFPAMFKGFCFAQAVLLNT